MTLFRKSTLLLCLLPFLSVQKNIAQETHKLYQTEYIQQRVKSITETYYLKTGIIKIEKKITPEFDNYHHFEQCLIASGTNADTWEASIKYLDDKYVKPRKDQDTAGFYIVDMYNIEGIRFGEQYRLKNEKWYCKAVCKYGRNDWGRDVTAFCIYDSNDSLVFKQGYKYNDKHLLTEVDNYSVDDKITDRTIYSYIAFDINANWIKKKETRKDKNGKITGVVTIKRRITYY